MDIYPYLISSGLKRYFMKQKYPRSRSICGYINISSISNGYISISYIQHLEIYLGYISRGYISYPIVGFKWSLVNQTSSLRREYIVPIAILHFLRCLSTGFLVLYIFFLCISLLSFLKCGLFIYYIYIHYIDRWFIDKRFLKYACMEHYNLHTNGLTIVACFPVINTSILTTYLAFYELPTPFTWQSKYFLVIYNNMLFLKKGIFYRSWLRMI